MIEDREHLTSLIALSDTPHETKGLAKVNKDTRSVINISLMHFIWRDEKHRKSSPIKSEKTGLYLEKERNERYIWL